jgi:hypothetical protein
MILDDNVLDENKELEFSDWEIFTKIWTMPRLVFKYINDKSYDKYVILLLILSGISKSFDNASNQNMGDNQSLLIIIGACVFAGGLMGWILVYIYAGLLSWTGKWLHGKGNSTALVNVIAYASIPGILVLILLVPEIATFGINTFTSHGVSDAGLNLKLIWGLFAVIKFVLAIWALILVVIGISEVQKLSIGKSILNLILPVLIIIVPVFLIVIIFRFML